MAVAAHTLPLPAITREEANTLYEGLPGHIAANDRRNAVAAALTLLHLD